MTKGNSLVFLLLSLLLVCEVSWGMSTDGVASYEKYQESIRKEDFEVALAWLSRSALEGNSRAILEYSSKCLVDDSLCKNFSQAEMLTKELTHSTDVFVKGYACLLMSQYELKKSSDLNGRVRALDYLLLANAYGEEGALPRAIPILKSLSEENLSYAEISLSLINKELLSVKRESILFDKLTFLKSDVVKIIANKNSKINNPKK